MQKLIWLLFFIKVLMADEVSDTTHETSSTSLTTTTETPLTTTTPTPLTTTPAASTTAQQVTSIQNETTLHTHSTTKGNEDSVSIIGVVLGTIMAMIFIGLCYCFVMSLRKQRLSYLAV